MLRSLIFVSISLALAGCSSAPEFPVAKASGQVLCDGKPVPSVRVYFAPVAQKGKKDTGRPASGNAGEDGSFVLSTFGDEDGAVIGKHNIMVDGPHPEEDPAFDCACETDPKKPLQQVEIKATGENHFTINLPPRTTASRPSVSRDDLEDIANSDE